LGPAETESWGADVEEATACLIVDQSKQTGVVEQKRFVFPSAEITVENAKERFQSTARRLTSEKASNWRAEDRKTENQKGRLPSATISPLIRWYHMWNDT